MEEMQYDVVIVGAGPAGLACAIRYAQLCRESNKEIKICVLEKGAEVGAHILSWAVFDPSALNELLPQWSEQGAPIEVGVTSDTLYYLTHKRAMRLPTPPQMKNHGNYIISLSKLTRWLSVQAVDLGVDIFPGFCATEALYNEKAEVVGVRLGDMGLDKHGKQKANYQAGIGIRAKQVILAEGCRGSLSETIIQRYELRKQPQTYAIGLKEIWEIPQHHEPGKVIHTLGWPLDQKTYGGGFVYHFEGNLLSLGFVIGLDYENPYLDPYEEFQRFKSHPIVKKLLINGQCLSYGARALNEGGWQSIPTLQFPGGIMIGCSAGFMNVPQIKGSHNAMKSGMLGAEYVFELLQGKAHPVTLNQRIEESWVGKSLYRARNIRPGFRFGLWPGLIGAFVDTYVFRGLAPWTLSHRADHTALKKASLCTPIVYQKPDGIVQFDRMLSVSRANVFHEENQPVHLVLKSPSVALNVNWREYQGPEQRYCPAGVYEFVDTESGKQLQINAQNCIHCKTCDIKDPTQNITWIPPEGGGGPNYSNM